LFRKKSLFCFSSSQFEFEYFSLPDEMVNISEKKNLHKKIPKKKNQCKDERKLKTTTKESETQQKSNFGSQFQCSRAKDFRRRYESDSVGEWRNCVN